MSGSANTEFSPIKSNPLADRQFIVMTRGWARFMSEADEFVVEAGDVVHQRPGMVHYLFDYSSDMEYREVLASGDGEGAPAP